MASDGDELDAEIVDMTDRAANADDEPLNVGDAIGQTCDESDESDESDSSDNNDDSDAQAATLVEYDRLVTEAAYQVDTGILSLDAIEIPEGAAEQGFDTEQLRDDVEQFLRNHDLSSDTDDTPVAQTQDPHSIDWGRAYERCNVPVSKPQSTTQLTLILDISEQTPNSEAASRQIVKQAIRDDALLKRGTAGYVPREVVV